LALVVSIHFCYKTRNVIYRDCFENGVVEVVGRSSCGSRHIEPSFCFGTHGSWVPATLENP
jgi:hypothetical protein